MRQYGLINLPIMLGLFICLLITSYVVTLQDKKQQTLTQQNITQTLSDAAREQSALLQEFISANSKLLYFLLETPPIQGIDRAIRHQGIDPKDGTTTEIWETRLSTIFTALLSNYPDLFQIRLLNSKGKEMVRVDRINGLIQRIPESKLQHKAGRDYVQHTLKLPERNLYISELNLNQENGRIVYPLQPTIRFATPVYNENNQLFALLILNVSPSNLINMLRDISHNHQASLALVDTTDHMIDHPDPQYRFTRDLNPDIQWQALYQPQDWEQFPLQWLSQPQSTDRYISYASPVTLADQAYQGLSQLWLYNFIPEQQYKAALHEKRLANLGLFSIIVLIGLTILAALLFYLRKANQLKQSRTEFEAIINGASDGIIAFDSNCNIISYNAAALRLLPQLEQAHNHSDLFELELLPKTLQQELQEACKQLKPQTNKYTITLTQQQRELELQIVLSPIIEQQQQVGHALFLQDISEQKRYEKQIEHINASLEQQVQQRTEELEQAKQKAISHSNLKSAFVSTISHEMRTPLNGILGTLNLLQREQHSDSTQSLLELMESSATSLATLINDILDLSKIEAGKLELAPQLFNPIVLIEDLVCSMSAQAVNKGLDLDMDVSDIQHVQLKADPNRLKQILNNLISNAIKFTQQGTVGIYARSHLSNNNEHVVLEVEVRDTGIGIDVADQDKLFNTFVQATPHISSQFGGTGLGLSISKQLCEHMGGTIRFESQKDQGSIFRFFITTDKQEARSLNYPNPLHETRIRLCLSSVNSTRKWHRLLSHLGAVIAEDDYHYTVTDPRHPDFAQLCEHEQNRHNTILIRRPSDPASEHQDWFAQLLKPTRQANIFKLFVDDQNWLQQLLNNSGISPRKETLHIDLSDYTILIVDDNEINIVVAQGLLNAQGANVVTAHSGQEGLERLQQSPQGVDAILMDCQMPIMDGYEATKRIRSAEAGNHYQSIPIIAMTAAAMSGEREKCLAAGMDDYITKPLSAGHLFKLLQRYLSKRRAIKETTPPKDTDIEQAETLNHHEALLRLMNDQALYQDIIRIFLRDTPQKLQQLQQAVKQGDTAIIQQTCHAFKSQAGNVGADKLKQLLLQLEQTAGEAATTLQLAQIEGEYQMLKQQLKNIQFDNGAN